MELEESYELLQDEKECITDEIEEKNRQVAEKLAMETQ